MGSSSQAPARCSWCRRPIYTPAAATMEAGGLCLNCVMDLMSGNQAERRRGERRRHLAVPVVERRRGRERRREP